MTFSIRNQKLFFGESKQVSLLTRCDVSQRIVTKYTDRGLRTLTSRIKFILSIFYNFLLEMVRCMVLIYKMVAQHILRTYDVKKKSFPKKIGFNDSFDVNKCFQQIEIPGLLNMCA